MRVKFEVGQTWQYPKAYPGTKFTVTKIKDGQVQAFRTDLGKESGFANCDSKGYGDIDAGWRLAHDTDHWRAWQHNRPGECVCGIPRERCDYHR